MYVFAMHHLLYLALKISTIIWQNKSAHEVRDVTDHP